MFVCHFFDLRVSFEFIIDSVFFVFFFCVLEGLLRVFMSENEGGVREIALIFNRLVDF